MVIDAYEHKGNDEVGRLMEDFHQADPSRMHYPELARGVSHQKKTGGQENMSEAVQKYAEEYAKEYAKVYAKEYAKAEKANLVENVMKNMNFTLEQALDAAGIREDEREFIIKQLQP